jgi:hypothetical protein
MRHWTLAEALVYGRGVERPFLCGVHGDSRPSASVNVVKKKWYCYSCGASGGLTGEDALIEPDYEVMKNWFAQKMEEQRVYPESWLARWDASGVHPYWRQRVGLEAATAFRLGADPERHAVTYPLRAPEGTVLGVVRRNLGDDGPKYLYPKGIDVGRLLFNYSPVHRRTVVLVEGALDAIAFWNIGVTAFAIYGAVLGPEQAKLIERVDPDYIVTAFDADDAGWRAHCQVENTFKRRLVERMKWPRSWGKDVDEICPTRLRSVVDDLASPGLSCVGSSTCSSTVPPPRPSLRISRSTSSRSTSSPRRMQIARSVA